MEGSFLTSIISLFQVTTVWKPGTTAEQYVYFIVPIIRKDP